MLSNPKILIIQPAFIGDVILATSLMEKLHQFYPNGTIDILLRKGNESLLKNHPFVGQVIIWDKSKNKIKEIIRIISQIQRQKYDYVINLQRFISSGLMTGFSGAKNTRGFDKNPLSWMFTQKYPHIISTEKGQPYLHEIERNQSLISDLTDLKAINPKLYPSKENYEKIKEFTSGKFITISPGSVWMTKQYPLNKWIEFIQHIPKEINIYILGGFSEIGLGQEIMDGCSNQTIINLAGQLSFLDSAALMQSALMNYVNDSAPLHLCSATNSPVTAIFCSTIPEFGFGPLSGKSFVVQEQGDLVCRPCGLHGKKICPLGHFNCGQNINTNNLLEIFKQVNE